MNKALQKVLFAAGLMVAAEMASACTRVIYQGENEVMTARSMDWKSDVGTNLWILPNNVKRTGLAGSKSIQWTSKYGSVVATGYDISTTDGLNEKGLMANLLWLVESEYPVVQKNTKATDQVPGEKRLATLHLSLSDATGDSAIIEYINGKQVIHHSRKYQVMTNSPIFDQQLALNSYWQQIGGTVMLPGTNRAADRFARASFYTNAIPKNANQKHSLASVFSVIRNVSVPFGLNTAEEPNISSTRWRTVVDHKRGLYFFESAVSPNVFWVDLKDINFNDGQAKKLELGADQAQVYAGKANASFKAMKPFEFLGTQ